MTAAELARKSHPEKPMLGRSVGKLHSVWRTFLHLAEKCGEEQPLLVRCNGTGHTCPA